MLDLFGHQAVTPRAKAANSHQSQPLASGRRERLLERLLEAREAMAEIARERAKITPEVDDALARRFALRARILSVCSLGKGKANRMPPPGASRDAAMRDYEALGEIERKHGKTLTKHKELTAIINAYARDIQSMEKELNQKEAA